MAGYYYDLGEVGNRFIRTRDVIYKVDNQVHLLESKVDELLNNIQNICGCSDLTQFQSNLETIYNGILNANALLIPIEDQNEIISDDDKTEIAKMRQKIEMIDKICIHLTNKFAYITYKEQYNYARRSNEEILALTRFLNKLTLVIIFLTLALLWEAYTTCPNSIIAYEITVRKDIIIPLIIGVFLVIYYFLKTNEDHPQEAQRPDPP